MSCHTMGCLNPASFEPVLYHLEVARYFENRYQILTFQRSKYAYCWYTWLMISAHLLWYGLGSSTQNKTDNW